MYSTLSYSTHHMKSYLTDPISGPTYMYTTISPTLSALSTSYTKHHMKFYAWTGDQDQDSLLVKHRSTGQNKSVHVEFGYFRQYGTVFYLVRYGAVWCGVVHTFSHTLIFICLLGGMSFWQLFNNFICQFSRLIRDSFVSGRISTTEE